MKLVKRKKKAFTLIELVIVLAVLAIIALIAIPNFTKVRQDSLKKADIESCNQIKKITLMSIANEDIIVAGVGHIELSFNGDTISASAGSGAKSTSSSTNNGITLVDRNYEEYLKDVKKPQYKNEDDNATYIVNISSTSDVTVKTSKFDPASPNQ